MAREAETRLATFQCSVCFDEVAEVVGQRIETCGHIFCPDCVGGHVAAKVSEGQVRAETLTCPAVGCGGALTIGDVRAATWGRGDDATWESFSRMADEQMLEALVTDGAARRCPASTCNYIFMWSPTDARSFDCPACASSFCLACDARDGGVGPAHPNMSCADYVNRLKADAAAAENHEQWRRQNEQADSRFKALMRQEMRAGRSKPCPHCKTAITKTGGCDHHVCSCCHTKFCWTCGGFYTDERRTRSNTCGTTCQKRPAKWWTEESVGIKRDAAEGGTSAEAAGPSTATPVKHRSARRGEQCVVS